MKKTFIALSIMVAIIAVRMILSVAFNEQIAEVFCRISIGSLFLYFIICTFSKKSKKQSKT